MRSFPTAMALGAIEKQRETAKNSGGPRCYFGRRSPGNPGFPPKTRDRSLIISGQNSKNSEKCIGCTQCHRYLLLPACPETDGRADPRRRDGSGLDPKGILQSERAISLQICCRLQLGDVRFNFRLWPAVRGTSGGDGDGTLQRSRCWKSGSILRQGEDRAWGSDAAEHMRSERDQRRFSLGGKRA